MKLVSDVMTREPKCISGTKTIKDAAHQMREHSVGCLPVVDGTTLEGVLTDRDIVLRAVADGRDPNEVRAREAMSNKPQSIRDDRPIAEAADLLKRRAVRRLVAVDERGKPTGLLSLSDLAACRDDHDTAKAATDVFHKVCAAE